MGKKRKLNGENTSKPSAIHVPQGGRQYTVSIALPGSIITNVPTHELKSHLAASIARTAAIFCVDEIVVYDDGTPEKESGLSDSTTFLIRLLEYMETPQYLRKALYPMHRDLKFAGLMHPLDCPHHLRHEEASAFREGIAVENVDNNTLINTGLANPVSVLGTCPLGRRVTVQLEPPQIVSRNAPREKLGYYWGYQTRKARDLSSVFTACPWAGGYDASVGTSERGSPLDEIASSIPPFYHLLIVFGGVAGLEQAIQSDLLLRGTQPQDLFDFWVNVCPNQGSRTIRTEEASLITLAILKSTIQAKGQVA